LREIDCEMAGGYGADAWAQAKQCADACRWQYAIILCMSEDDTLRMYDLVGGDEKLRELVDRFYDLMDLESGFAELRAMHPSSLEVSREKLYRFLSGWTGGPDLYTPQYGPAFLRARHLPFPIGTSARDQWLTCMLMAMQDLGLDEDKQDVLLQAFFKTADWMRNQGS
jgi:hemoglobin